MWGVGRWCGGRCEKAKREEHSCPAARGVFSTRPPSLHFSPSIRSSHHTQFLDAPPLALATTPASGTLITLSNASTLHAWRGADGAKAWESVDALPLCPSGAAALAATAATVLLACDGLAVGLDAVSGTVKWRVPVGGAPTGSDGAAALTAVAGGGGEPFFALAWTGTGASASSLGFALLAAADGTLTAAESVRPGVGRLAGTAALVPASAGAPFFLAAVLSADGGRLCSVPAGPPPAAAARCAPIPAGAGPCTTLTTSLPGLGGGAAPTVALTCEHGALGAALSPDALPTFTPLLTAGGPSAAAPAPGGSVAAVGVDVESGNVLVATAAPGVSGGAPLLASSHALKWAAPGCAAASTPPVHAWALPPRHPPATDPDAAGSLFIVASDGASALVRLAASAPGGRAIGLSHWSRPADAAAGAVAAVHAPLPPATATPAATAALPVSARLASTLRTEWLAAKAMAGAATPAEAGVLRAARAAAGGGRGRAVADRHGFRQAVLVLGPAGTLTALHSGDGAVLWRLPGLVAAGGAAATRLLSWSTGDGRTAAPSVLVLWPGGWAAVDAWAGAVLSTGTTPFPVDQVIELPGAVRDGGGEGGSAAGSKAGGRVSRAGVAEQRVVILIERTPSSSSDAPRWALLPPTPAAAALAAAAAPLRWWRADGAAGTLTGYVADGGGSDSTRATAGTAGVAWRHAFGPGSILATASPPTTAPSATAAVVTGTRTLKLKPAPGGWAFVLASDAGRRGLTASLFDGASGQAIFRQAHPGAAGPATASWLGDGAGVAYTFSGPPPTWGSGSGGGSAGGAHATILPPAARLPPRPWHLATIDIFDARRAKGMSAGSLALAALGLKGNKARGGGGGEDGGALQSAWDPPAIEVDRATFSLPVHPLSLTPTRTARGVAPTVLLVATAGGEVLALPRRVVDPRRPAPGDAAAVAAGAAEGLPPYHPALPAPPTAFATHGARLGHHGGGRPPLIAVSPAVLESTALVFGAGGAGDAWGTRLQPAASFDLPPPDFPYGLLAAVTGLTGVGAALLKAAAGRAALRAKWE